MIEQIKLSLQENQQTNKNQQKLTNARTQKPKELPIGVFTFRAEITLSWTAQYQSLFT